MTMTIDLPAEVERAYQDEAKARGVSLEAVVSRVLVSNRPESRLVPVSSEIHFVEEHGVKVLDSGYPIEARIVDETIEALRRELGTLR